VCACKSIGVSGICSVATRCSSKNRAWTTAHTPSVSNDCDRAQPSRVLDYRGHTDPEMLPVGGRGVLQHSLKNALAIVIASLLTRVDQIKPVSDHSGL
jgi:hypothetical protein